MPKFLTRPFRFISLALSATLSVMFSIMLSLLLSWGMAHSLESQEVGTVDVVPDRYKFGQDLYIETCAACHIALPPAVLPNQTWQILLQDSEHYGTTITPPKKPTITLIWNYLNTFSRPLRDDEETPFRINQARHFKALHPQVKFSEPVTIATCATCHPKADVFNFRTLKTDD